MSQEGPLVVLALTAASVGAVHSLAPDHWAPFAAAARAQGWSALRTAGVTLLCGFGHVTVSVLLGLFGLFLGIGAVEAFGRRLESAAGVLLVVFGIAYAAWGLRQRAGGRFHGHTHAHYDHVHEPARITVWTLFLLFSADPCVAVIPLLLAAARSGTLSALAVVAAYELATLAAMIALVAASRTGALLLPGRWAGRYGQALAGAVIAGVGLATSLLGW